MTEETAGSGDVADAAQEPRECMPCRGSGKVISKLGGDPAEVICPWCDGSGVRVAGIDAQARWSTQTDGGGQAQAAPADADAQAGERPGAADGAPADGS